MIVYIPGVDQGQFILSPERCLFKQPHFLFLKKMGAYLLLKILRSPWGQYLWLLSWNSSPQWHLGHPWMIWTFTENCFTSCLSNAILFRMSILRQALLLLANEFPFLWQCSPGYDTTFTSVLCLLWIRPSIPRTELSCNGLLAFTQSTLCPLLPHTHTQKLSPLIFSSLPSTLL